MKKLIITTVLFFSMLACGTLGGFLFNYIFYGKIATHPIWSQSRLVKSMDNRLQIIKQTEKVVVQNSESIADIANTPAAAVVRVTAVDDADTAAYTEGNGIIVSSDGVIATTDDVVPSAATAYVTFADGTVATATSVYRDIYSGLVFVRVDAHNLSTIAFANSDDAQSGKRLISVARDVTGRQTSFATGGVMGLAPFMSVQSPASDHLQGVMEIDFAAAVLDAAIGAPVVDYQGNMVGLIARKNLAAQGSTAQAAHYYAIAANDVYESFAHYLQLGDAATQQTATALSDTMTLGIDYKMITPVDVVVNKLTVDHGARISALPVAARGAQTTMARGVRSGLHVGDIVTAVGDTQLDDAHTLSRVLRSYKSTDAVTMTVIRGTETLTLPIVK